MTDICEKSLKTIRKNFKENNLNDADDIKLCQLAWGNHSKPKDVTFTHEGFPVDYGASFDLVIASDVVYLPECIEPLIKSMRYFCSQRCLFVNNRIRLDPF